MIDKAAEQADTTECGVYRCTSQKCFFERFKLTSSKFMNEFSRFCMKLKNMSRLSVTGPVI